MVIPMITYAGGIIVNEKYEVLFVYSDDMWDFPCDLVKEGESLKQAALRAAVEKTNIDPANIRILREMPPTLDMEGGTIINTKLFICEYDTNPAYMLHADFERFGIFESKWFSMSALPTYSTSVSNKYITNFLSKLFSRTPILCKPVVKS